MPNLRRYWQLIRFLFIYIGFKFRQYRSKTSEKPVIQTTYGPIKGVKRISCFNDPFYSFEKVPFAKPPLGELRFKAPQPPEPWTEVKDCTSEGPAPLQNNIVTKRIEGSEDCLYLSIFSKNLNPTKPLPVMVWIYGGGFETGGTTKDFYSPDYFMQRDVVLILITYRVGPFGFLSLEDPKLDIPGNAGLKDQIIAMKWIKKNCLKFGGDTNNITVIGESAGAASAHYMMCSEAGKGLFHKAIIMSGSILATWANIPHREWALRLAKKMNYNGIDNDEKIYEFLKNSKGNQILKAEFNLLTEDERQNRMLFAFGPVIEPYITEHCVIPEDPLIMSRKAWSTDIPVIIGGTSFEGLIIYEETKSKYSHLVNNLKDCEHLVPLDLNLSRDSSKCHEFGLKLKKQYFDGRDPNMNLLFNYLDLLSYKFFWHPVHRTIKSRLKYAKAPTYLYRFDFDSKTHNIARLFVVGPNSKGACHGDDCTYLFYTAITPHIHKNSSEYKLIQQFVGTFIKFAENGNPNCQEIYPLIWNPVTSDEDIYKCLNYSHTTDIIPLPEYENLKLWDSFYPEEMLY